MEQRPTARQRRRPRTAWELRELTRPLVSRRRPSRTAGERGATEKFFDPALVEYVWQGRYVLVGQLQRRFPEWLPSPRTAQRHAKRLIERGLLAAAPLRGAGPNFPTVLCATGRGMNLIRETYGHYGHAWNGPLTEERKAKGLAVESVLHELVLSELELAVHQTVESREDLVLLERERRFFRADRRLVYHERGRERRLVPDAGFLTAVRTAEGRKLLPLCLVEMENGTHSVAKLRRKFSAYTTWLATGAKDYLPELYAWHSEPERRPVFRLLLVAHDRYGTVSDERRLLDMLAALLDQSRALRQATWLTTAADLKCCQADEPPLANSVWRRARDLSRFVPEYERRKAEWGSVPTATRYARQREFVAEVLPHLPGHPLFPAPDTVSDAQELTERASLPFGSPLGHV